MRFSLGKQRKIRTTTADSENGAVQVQEKFGADKSTDKKLENTHQLKCCRISMLKRSRVSHRGRLVQRLYKVLDAGLWDEIRIESAPFTVNEGVESTKTPREHTYYQR